MQDKPLNQSEQDLLDIIRHLFHENGAFLRSELSVIGRGRGLEVAAPLQRLKSLELVHEYDKKPFFLLRLFGARSKAMVRFDQAAYERWLALIATSDPAVQAALPIAGFEPPPIDAHILENALPEFNLVEEVQAEIMAEVLADPTGPHVTFGPAEPLLASNALAEATQSEVEVEVEVEVETVSHPQALIDTEIELEPTDKRDDQPEASPQEAPQAEEPSASEDAAEVPVDGVAEDAGETQTPSDQPSAPSDSEPSQADETVAPVVVTEPPASTPIIDLAFLPEFSDVYSDDMGGEAVWHDDFDATVDSDMLEGLNEMLEVLGLELTQAGEALIQDRLAKDLTPGDALLEVVLFAFAHAAHYDMASSHPAPAEDLQDYAKAILREIDKLSQAGEINIAAFEHQSKWILQLADNTQDRSALVAELFEDPIAGIAPPALLPEELRGIPVDPDDEDSNDA